MSKSLQKRFYLTDENAIDLFASEPDEPPRLSRDAPARERLAPRISREVPAGERSAAPLERRSLARPLTLVSAFLAGTLFAALAVYTHDQWRDTGSPLREAASVPQVIETIQAPPVVADAHPAVTTLDDQAVNRPEEQRIENEPPRASDPRATTASQALSGPVTQISIAPPAPSRTSANVPPIVGVSAATQPAAAVSAASAPATPAPATSAGAITAPITPAPTAAPPVSPAPTPSVPTAPALTAPVPGPSPSESRIPAPPVPAPTGDTAAAPASAPPPVSSPVARAPAAAAIPTPPAVALDTARIQDTLTRYRRAFSDLDAEGVVKVWPNVNQRSVSRAFDRLRQQEVSFEGCQIVIQDVRAEARCSGTTRYVPRIGSHSARVDPRHWRFSLAKVREEWLIESVDAR